MESFLKRQFNWIILATLGLILALAMPVLSQPSPSSPQQLVQQGREFYQQGKFSESEQVLQAAQREYRNQGNALNQALVSNYLSLVYQQQGKWDDAQSAIASSLDLLGSTPTNTEKNRVFASVLTTQGRLQLALGQSEQAFTSWQQAAKVYQNLGDKAGIQGSLINQAQALESMGFYKRSCNTVLQALEFKDRTCEEISEDTSLEQILQQIERQPDSQLKAVGLRSLGNLLRSLGQLDSSETALTESLEVATQLQAAQDISLAFLNLGNTQRAKAKQAEDFNESADQIRRLYQSALANYQDSIDNSSLPAVQLQAQLNILSLFLKRSDSQARLDRDLTEAQQLVVSIQSLLNQLQPSQMEVEGRIHLACSILECDRLIKGQREPNLLLSIEELNNLLNVALQQAEDLGDAKLKAYSLGTIGKIYEYQENWQQAQIFTQAALNISSSPELAYQWQWQIGRILKQSSEQALPFYEKAVDNLKLLRRDLISLNPDVQFNFRDQIEPVYRQYVDLLLKAENPSQKNLTTARNTIEDLQLAELDNFFRDACVEVKTENIDEIAEKYDPTAAIVHAIILPDRLAIIFKLANQPLAYYQTNVLENNLRQSLQKLRSNLSNSPTNTEEVRTEATKVYDLLIKPLETELDKNQQIDTLVFVLDRPLQSVPMAVLYDQKSDQYLVEKKYALALASGLKLIEPSPWGQVRTDSIKAFIGGVGIPQEFAGFKFEEIKLLEEELEAVSNNVPTNQPLLNEEFTQVRLQNQLASDRYSVIHIKTHGVFSSNPEQTFILAYQRPINSQELGDLVKSASKEKQESIELLILSACRTAEGDDRATLGLSGIAVRSGAHSVIATLWVAKDAPNTELMRRFYQELFKVNQNNPQITKAKALHLAQQALAQSDIGNLPHYWATYVLVGSWL